MNLFPNGNHTFLSPSTLVQPWPMQKTLKFKLAWFPPAPQGSSQLHAAHRSYAKLPAVPLSPCGSLPQIFITASCGGALFHAAPHCSLRLPAAQQLPAAPRNAPQVPQLPAIPRLSLVPRGCQRLPAAPRSQKLLPVVLHRSSPVRDFKHKI